MIAPRPREWQVKEIEALCLLAAANSGDGTGVRLTVDGTNRVSVLVTWDIVNDMCMAWRLYMEDPYASPLNTEGTTEVAE